MQIAVSRRSRDGRREPGVVYVDVIAFGHAARECVKRLSAGDRIGLSGRLEREESRTPAGNSVIDHGVLIDQIDFLDEPKQRDH